MVEVLDLKSFHGGLTPTKKGGGKQTKGLRFDSADGREWKFRSVDKDPTPVLPEALQDSFVDSIIQDQISASLPANGPVVDALTDAAGILHVNRRLYVLSQMGRGTATSRARDSRRRCPAERYAAGRSASPSRPTAASAACAATGAPPR